MRFQGVQVSLPFSIYIEGNPALERILRESAFQVQDRDYVAGD